MNKQDIELNKKLNEVVSLETKKELYKLLGDNDNDIQFMVLCSKSLLKKGYVLLATKKTLYAVRKKAISFKHIKNFL